MPSARELRLLWWSAALALGAIGLASASPAAQGQESHAGPVTGVIDGVAFEGDQYYDHGWEHAGMCASKADSASCWYNVDTFNLPEDGGNHFARPKPPRNYFISLPYKYQVNRGPEGYSVDANIVKVGEWYYDTNPIRTAVGALAAIEEGRS